LEHKFNATQQTINDLKARVAKLEQSTANGTSAGASSSTSSTSSTSSVSSVSSRTTPGGHPKVYDGNGVPQPGQIIGVSSFGVADPLVGVGAPDPSNKQKYNSIDIGKAKNTDPAAASKGRDVAAEADQGHKDFVEDNTEEFEKNYELVTEVSTTVSSFSSSKTS